MMLDPKSTLKGSTTEFVVTISGYGGFNSFYLKSCVFWRVPQ